ncbi:hypothetical protein LS66_007520 [Helicobacter sp. MIT 03-1614]|uniref:hypothetical protein n=1 Tax=Helicobacter sp. MIT 03-1614 TaxID=1548147 RepID=UPI00051422EE|nr:hypothetical protein [Helicobacter sp. MIT 03-1614]TLD87734.1 hypothetical protein LS66_007520 [Helicobacter sp. MIT 03-1614]
MNGIEIFKIISGEYVDERGEKFDAETRVFACEKLAMDYFRSQVENNNNISLASFTDEEAVEFAKHNESLHRRYFFDTEILHLKTPKCRHCGNPVEASAVDTYKYFCPECEEDFMSFEVI